MKSILLVLFVPLFSIALYSQSDVIYPTNSNKKIRNCKIDEIRNVNVVYYSKNFISDSVSAKALIKDGIYLELLSIKNNYIGDTSGTPGLYNGHDYHYYGQLQNNAQIKRNVGIGLTIFGLGAFIGSTLGKRNEGNTGIDAVYWGGALLTDLGIVLWISGGIKSKNNKRAMELTKRNVNLSFGPTMNGVGLLLSLN